MRISTQDSSFCFYEHNNIVNPYLQFFFISLNAVLMKIVKIIEFCVLFSDFSKIIHGLTEIITDSHRSLQKMGFTVKRFSSFYLHL